MPARFLPHTPAVIESRLARQLTLGLVLAAGALGLQGETSVASAEKFGAPAPAAAVTLGNTALAAASAEQAQSKTPKITIKYPEKSGFKANEEYVSISAAKSGLFTEREPRGTRVETVLLGKPSGDWMFVNIIGNDGTRSCGWIETQVLSSSEITDPDNPCLGELKRMRNYYYIGRWFNCRMTRIDQENNCVSASLPQVLTAECDRRLYGANPTPWPGFSNMNPSKGKAGPKMYIGQVPEGEAVGYRYTTNETNSNSTVKAVQTIVVSTSLGWGHLKLECMTEEQRNSRIGGMEREEGMVAGPNPKSGS